MLDFDNDTIVGIATPPGEGGIGIIRISGPEALHILEEIFRAKRDLPLDQMKSNTLYYGWIVKNDVKIDEVLAVVMRKPYSYTKENVVEIHCHGGIIPIKKILDLCLEKKCRMAEPGEFTKRAFLNGRIDLSQAEAVMDLIQAKTDMAARSSLEQMEGTLSSRIHEAQSQLLDLLALIEVNIDYPEDDLEDAAYERLGEEVNDLLNSLGKLLETSETGRIIREGLKTAIVGRPNVGKSSLLNALLKENRAIVTEIPGTTRDALEEYLNIKGILIRIIDTAGIRETEDIVESIGVARSKELIQNADLILIVLDASMELEKEDLVLLNEIKSKKSIIVLNKTDVPIRITQNEIKEHLSDYKIIKISAKEGIGIDELENEVYETVFQGKVTSSSSIIVSNTRHKKAIEGAIDSLKKAAHTIEEKIPLDFVSIDIRDAWHHLGEITGETVDEDVIDRIFSQFCLGK